MFLPESPSGRWRADCRALACAVLCAWGPVAARAGGLQYDLDPPGAVSAGARWSIYEGSSVVWRTSGFMITNLPADTYEVMFKSVSGWIAPSNELVAVGTTDYVVRAATYLQPPQTTATLRVHLLPTNAWADGAGWRISSTSAWQQSGTALTNLSPGSRYVYFSSAYGWNPPVNRSVTLVAGTNEVTGTYSRAAGLRVRVLLQGAYLPTFGRMATNLQPRIPATSPYADDRRTVAEVPTNAVDWVLLQVYATNGAAPFFSRSAFLRPDGYIAADDGTPGITAPDLTGNYVLGVKHRNHLAIRSAGAVSFVTNSATYDFTVVETQFLGGTNSAVRMGTNSWAMIAGDADGDGTIRDADREIHASQMGRTGYLPGDFNLNGAVAAADYTGLSVSNLNRSAAAAGDETLLLPALEVSPPESTVGGGATAELQATSTGLVRWVFTRNESGASISSTSGASVVYTAGVPGFTDILEAWEPASGNLSRMRLNVVSNAPDAFGRAVILAGSSGPSDPTRPATHFLAEKARETLAYRGFTPDSIHYYSFSGSTHADGDITAANVELLFTNGLDGVSRLFVYMVDHGASVSGAASFRLNASEWLAATTLDGWLDRLQDEYGTEVSLVVDCCSAGSFLDEVAYAGPPERVALSSCGTNEATYFIANGLVSFSEVFFNGVLLGVDLGQAFLQASNAMSYYQQAMASNLAAASGMILGAEFIAGALAPSIGSVCGNQTISENEIPLLWVDDVVSAYPIERVWASIVPPDHQPGTNDPVRDIPEADLAYHEDTGRYEYTGYGFTGDGTYQVAFYAQDTAGAVSAPRLCFITQSEYRERVILVAGGPAAGAEWDGIRTIAGLVYRTLTARRLGPDDIWCMSADPDLDFDGDLAADADALPTQAGLVEAITNWAAGASKLTVYLVGGETNGAYRLGEAESLNADTLDYWLDAFQADDRPVGVILEMPEAGGFLAALTPPENRSRYCIACAQSGEPALWAADGLVSFSSFFMSYLFLGEPIWDAFDAARRGILYASGPLRQTALLDDDGDGRPNEKSEDGAATATQYIGPAFLTGADLPAIGSVNPDAWIDTAHAALVWAAEVSAAQGVSNVVCYVTPPDYDPADPLPSTNLSWNAALLRYEAALDGLTNNGTYTLTFQAQDREGSWSEPVQAFLENRDFYEPDNTATQAVDFAVGAEQYRNIHVADDVDWVRFFAASGAAFQVEAEQTGTNVDVRLDIYVEELDGTLRRLDFLDAAGEWDRYGKGAGYTEECLLDLAASPSLTSGVYYVRVSPADPTGWGADSDYTLKVYVPAGTVLIIAAVNLLTGGAVPDAEAVIDGGTWRLDFNGAISVSQDLPSGSHSVQVTAPAGYYPAQDPNRPDQPDNPKNLTYGNPRNLPSGTLYAGFQFMPYVVIDGQLLDAHVGAHVEDAVVKFTATSGKISGQVYDGYPNFATYETPWLSEADGDFPDEVLLPPVTWNLLVEKTGYSNLVVAGVIPSPPSGISRDLGVFRMYPVDLDGDGLADTWEDDCFPPGYTVLPGEDDDEDGVDNEGEYFAGTHPMNPDSTLGDDVVLGPQEAGWRLAWPVVPGRAYGVERESDLVTGVWARVSGIQTAGFGQTSMEWTDSSAAAPPLYYRLTVIPPPGD